MKHNYIFLMLLLASFSFSQAQCPDILGNDSTTELVHFIIEDGTCSDYPTMISIEGSSFQKKSCIGTDLKYELYSGSPLNSADTFSANMGFGSCDYLDGELRRETLSTTQFSEIVKTIKVYPNPLVNGTDITVQFNNAIHAKLYIYDLTGKTILSDDIDNMSTKRINVSHLNNGIYMLHIATDNATTTRKIVVMK